jgi:hypothetical protein
VALLDDLGDALAAGGRDRAEGRAMMVRMWDALAEDDHAGRLILAHYLADLQDDLDEEVGWDEIALANADKVTDDDLRTLHPSLSLRGFVPSLQLNLADGYRRQGRLELAARALDRSMSHNDALPTDLSEQVAYRAGILAGQARVAALVAAGDSTPMARADHPYARA